MTMIRRYGRAFPAYALHTALEYPADIAALLICETGVREKLRALLAGTTDSFRNVEPSRNEGFR